MNLHDLSIRQRLAIGFGAVLALLLLQLAFSLIQARTSQARVDEVLDEITPLAALGRDLRLAYLDQSIAMRSYAISGDDSDLQAYRDALDRAAFSLAALNRRQIDQEARALLDQAIPQMDRYMELGQAFIANAPQLQVEELRARESELATARVTLLAPLSAFIDLYQDRQAEATVSIQDLHDRVWTAQLGMSALMVVAAVIAAVGTTRAVRQPALRLVRAARALGAGQYERALGGAPLEAPWTAPQEYHDELHELGETFRHMARDLWARESRLQAQGRVERILASNLDAERLATEALREVMEFTNCELGVIYRHDEDEGLLVPLATVGLDAALVARLPVGEGIPGRAAAERDPVIVREIPPDTPFRVTLGFDRLPARTVAAMPMEVGDQLIGVFLLASVRELSPELANFVQACSQQLGVSLENAMAHDEILTLAFHLQEQNEEIAQQAEEIQVQNEELEAQNEELEAQRSALIEADRQKDEFLSIAVHELRSPITGIKGMAQRLRRRAEREPALREHDESLETIDHLSDTLVTRINRLLGVTRARMGALDIRPEPGDLVAITREVVEQWRQRSRGRVLSLAVAPDSIDGAWDHGGLGQVLDNLIENAIRYSPDETPVEVVVGLDGEGVILSVSDTGIGIPTESIDRIFELYYRDETATNVSVEGLGLGLYITRQIVDAHGGEIVVVSAPGLGSTFSVRLPRYVASRDA